MPTTTEILEIATSANMLVEASGEFDVLKDIVAPIVIVVFSMLLERLFGVTKWPSRIVTKIVQKSPQRIRQRIIALGWNVSITQVTDQSSEGIGIGTPADAQRAPTSQGTRVQPP